MIGIFIFVLYGLIAFGMMLAVKQSITHAAADGARAAIAVPSADGDGNGVDDRIDRARDRVDEALDWLGSRYEASDTEAVIGPCPEAVDDECITVTITYPYGTRPIVPPAPGLGLVTPEQFQTQSVVKLT